MGGNVKLILGLVWMLIQKYHIQAEDAKRAMLDWIQVNFRYAQFKDKKIKKFLIARSVMFHNNFKSLKRIIFKYKDLTLLN
mgnify:CR=1 FL=1